MRNSSALHQRRSALCGLTLLTGVSAAVGHACEDFPSTLCVSCDDTCLDGLKCDPILHVCVPTDDPGACAASHTAGSAGQAAAPGTPTSSDAGEGGGGHGEGEGDTNGQVNCTAELSCQQPSIYTGAQLEADCASPLSIQLEAGCVCGPTESIRWRMSEEFDGFELSTDGLLTGEPEPGVYEFEATASLNYDHNEKRDFTLTVSGPCRVVFVADNADTGRAELRAARLDGSGSGSEGLPPSTLPEATLSSFDVSPDGAFLARVTESSHGSQLELLRMQRSEARLEPLNHTEEYAAHAFSPDSRYLALVTRDSADEMRRLHLVDLTGSPQVTDSTSVGFASHLTWGASDWLLYLGASTAGARESGSLAVQEVFVSNGLVVSEREQPDLIYANGIGFEGFLVGGAGYLALHETLPVYVDRNATTVRRHHPIEALSPNLMWMTHDYDPGARVDYVTEQYDHERPFGTASQCELVLAWSQDGSKFLCTGSDRWFVYTTTTSAGSLEYLELDIPGDFDRVTFRMAFSTSGAWLALVPNGAGMILVRTSEWESAEHDVALHSPVLSGSDGLDWDFFFTSLEEHLVVQRGNQLLVGPPSASSEADFWSPDELELPEIPNCLRGWFPAPEAWCGAPRFVGNWAVSPDEDHLAFSDQAGNVQVVGLAKRTIIDAGSLSESCVDAGALVPDQPPSRCIQFQ